MRDNLNQGHVIEDVTGLIANLKIESEIECTCLLVKADIE